MITLILFTGGTFLLFLAIHTPAFLGDYVYLTPGIGGIGSVMVICAILLAVVMISEKIRTMPEEQAIKYLKAIFPGMNIQTLVYAPDGKLKAVCHQVDHCTGEEQVVAVEKDYFGMLTHTVLYEDRQRRVRTIEHLGNRVKATIGTPDGSDGIMVLPILKHTRIG